MTYDSAMAGRVFVSYARVDSGRVDNLCNFLNSAGIPVWRDTASLWPGEDWRARVRGAIRSEALVFLACFSRQGISRVKGYQNEELVLAVEELRLRPPGHPWLIPIRFDDCELPDFGIGAGRTLADLQQADLFGEQAGQNADRLIQAIQRAFDSNRTSDTATPRTTGDYLAGRSATFNLEGAKGVQIGDGGFQSNTFRDC
jgi:TIR domain